MFGPSEGALSGSSWVSIKIPAIPIDIAALESGFINSRCPSLLPPFSSW